MDNFDGRQEELFRKEQEIKERELEIKLRELELEVNKSSTESQPVSEPPLYSTRKHEPKPSSLQVLSKKIVKYAKFLGFTIGAIVLVRVAFIIGMWLAYGLFAMGIIFVGYQIFLAKDD